VLTRVQKKHLKVKGGRFAIVASRYNARYVDSMVREAKKILLQSGADQVKIIRVPGAYEIPVVASRLARLMAPGFDAIICLGVILRGETTHAQHIGEAVTLGLTQIQVATGVPIIHEVLLLENEEQAKVRCLGKGHNRGAEAAQTALEMAKIVKDIGLEDDVPF
jgi:6,7-dimethyl-8-ribityllumazine synthase